MKDDDDAAMMNEIAKLAGRINTYRQRGRSSAPSRGPYNLRSRRGTYSRARAPFGRGMRGGRPYSRGNFKSATNATINRPCSHFTRTGKSSQ